MNRDEARDEQRSDELAEWRERQAAPHGRCWECGEPLGLRTGPFADGANAAELRKGSCVRCLAALELMPGA